MLDNVTPVQPDGCQIKGIMLDKFLSHGSGIFFTNFEQHIFHDTHFAWQ